MCVLLKFLEFSNTSCSKLVSQTFVSLEFADRIYIHSKLQQMAKDSCGLHRMLLCVKTALRRALCSPEKMLRQPYSIPSTCPEGLQENKWLHFDKKGKPSEEELLDMGVSYSSRPQLQRIQNWRQLSTSMGRTVLTEGQLCCLRSWNIFFKAAIPLKGKHTHMNTCISDH